MEYDFDAILLRMKQAKASCGLTNIELAARSGVPVGTINKIMAGNTKEPKLPAFISIAHALDVSVDFLVYGSTAKELSEEEFLHIKKYRSLDQRGQEAVDNVLEHEYRAAVAAEDNLLSKQA